jgi:lysyl-tRNA synthetase class 2
VVSLGRVGDHVVVALTWAARVVGLVTLAAVLLPMAHRLRGTVAEGLGVPRSVGELATVVVLLAGVVLLLLATGLRRRKRSAWQAAVAVSALLAVGHLLHRDALLAGALAAVFCLVLLSCRSRFGARSDPIGRGMAVWVAVELLVAGFLLDWLLLIANSRKLAGAYSVVVRARQAGWALVGVSGPVHFRRDWFGDLVADTGIAFGIAALLAVLYFLLRAAEPRPVLTETDVADLRGLLGKTADSLGYFALRQDKSVIFSPSGKAALSYRVLAGVALVAADPLGDVEAWPRAIERYLVECWEHSWVPAVLGCGEQAALVWRRYGFDALELGDEAVIDTAQFTLQGRAMRSVRQAVTRTRRAGYQVRIRRAGKLTDGECSRLDRLAETWRSGTERGFSMTLSRFAEPGDGDCVVVTAEHEGTPRGLLQFVPWGDDGLSLDMMRRDRSADNGLNELMIAELLTACPGMGIRRVSLNFAVFRAALERGERVGAGPVARVWARLLRFGSRWWQIDSLYRFNAKFGPDWVPRFVVFPGSRDLPRVALAAFEAEGYGGRPRLLLRALHRS